MPRWAFTTAAMPMRKPATALPCHRGTRAARLAFSALACLAVLTALAVQMPSTGLEQYRERKGSHLIPGLDAFTKRNVEMLRQGLIKLSPMRFAPEHLASSSPAAVALYGRPCPPPDAAKLQPGQVPSAALLPAPDKTLPSGVAEISLVCGSQDLFGAEHGIVTHPMERGPAAERLTWVSARLGDQFFLESPMGLRIHGGLSRQIPVKSFAMVFRKEYCGTGLSPAGLFFGPETPSARQFLLIGASQADRYLGALATDIAELIGCKTSRQMPALVYLNGTRIDAPYFVCEQQCEEFVKSRFHLRHIDWVRLKDKSSEGPSFQVLDRWSRSMSHRLTFQDAASHFNLQDLCAWVVAMSFTVTVDNNQGAFYRNLDAPGAAWQTLTWDLDGAFKRGFEGDPERLKMFSDDPFQRVLLGLRARLFRRLVAESAEFRDYFRQFAHETVTRRLPREKLLGLTDRYLELARLQPKLEPGFTPVLRKARSFLETRSEAFLAYVDQSMDAAARQAGQDLTPKSTQSPPQAAKR